DDRLEERLDFAFSQEHGYLTACPTNVGTGIRASVMVHLPALSMVNQVQQLFKGVTQVGLAVRGLYGEGTEASGHIYQLSNQVTLGRTEQEIIENINSVTKQIIQQEQQAREVLSSNAKAQIEDRVYRAYGILTQARLLSTQEAMNLLSDLRLGIGLGLLSEVSLTKLNQLTVLAQPQAVQGIMKQQLPAQQRDYYRAALLRENLKDK
ncbi:MAG TPA: ATP--guanido phosphotransferase, partial [Bacillota bacterium]|nr:ATP--guanido phosphotransferase [Bacillota bacterium]